MNRSIVPVRRRFVEGQTAGIFGFRSVKWTFFDDFLTVGPQGRAPVDPQILKKTLLEELENWRSMGLSHLPKAMQRLQLVPSTEARPPTSTQSQGSSPLPPADVPQAQEAAEPVSERTVPAREERTPVSRPAATVGPPVVAVHADAEPYGAALPAEARRQELNSLAQQVAGCQRCSILSTCRKQTVFGVGTVQPRLCFLGEAPGADEDLAGEPFVGAAGQLLNKIIAACRMQREDVYILNTIKCRPPGNRNPAPEEMENCWEFTERQLDLLQPEFICCLGRIAAQKLLRTTQHVGALRGRFYAYRGSRVVVTYHPAYLLRTESAKKQTWEDMKMLMREMGVNL